jgi:MFS family permease
MHQPSVNAAATAQSGISRSETKTLALASLGGALEFFDFIIAAFFVKVLTGVFFPPGMPGMLAQIALFGIFAAGYIARPIGGIFFAHFGDRVGRKRMFSLSLCFMALPTLIIGLLPSYGSIGIAAPLLFLVCRITQGLSVGGEMPGAWIFCAEHVQKNRVALACGFLMSGLIAGMLLGSLSAKWLITHLSPADMQAWGWRPPFIVGGVFGLVSVYLRRYLDETPVFKSLQTRRALSNTLPLATVVTQHRSAMLVSFLATWVFSGIFVIYFLYTPTYLQTTWHMAAADVFTATSWAILMLVIGTTCAGFLADTFGAGKVYIAGCVLIAAAVYALYQTLLVQEPSWTYVFIAGGFATGVIAICPYMIVQSFPASVRFTGFALTYNTGYAIFGGTAPALLSYFVGERGFTAMPAIYMIALCVLGAVIGLTWREPAHRGA